MKGLDGCHSCYGVPFHEMIEVKTTGRSWCLGCLGCVGFGFRFGYAAAFFGWILIVFHWIR